MKDVRKLRKQGNSLMLTISKELVEDLNWKEGDRIMLESETQSKDSYLIGPKILKAGKT